MTLILSISTFTSCNYDDTDLWNAIDDVNTRVENLEAVTQNLNSELSALHTIVNALQNNVSITQVTQTSTGYEILFSDGKTAVINHGQNGTNGKDGVNAPAISLRQDTDGNYYWTIDGQWLEIDGKRVRANGIDGQDGKDGHDGKDGQDGKDGKDGLDGKDGQDGKDGMDGHNSGEAPKLRINPDTKEWEISTDNGQTWHSMGVVAEGSQGAPGASGKDGDSLFSNIDTTDANFVKFVLADGTEIIVPRYDSTMPLFAIEGVDEIQVIRSGESKTYDVKATNVADLSIQKPDGWRVVYSEGKLKVTAPAKENIYAEESGIISIVTVSPNNKSLITKFAVRNYELKILTFEDVDANFSSYTLEYGDEPTISTWSDLIDKTQYGGPLLYGPDDGGYAMGMDEPYKWYDENNTELKHEFPEGYGMYCFWSGGHAISNYASTDIKGTGGPSYQLTINGTQGSAGHNGSANFAVHFGYIDDSGFTMTSTLPSLTFGDNIDRIIDHMWVMPNNYALNCYINGNSLTSKLGDDDFVKIIATGYNGNGQKTKEIDIIIANGKNFITNWTKWDLSGLGKVAKVEFNILGTSNNGYGFSQPAYFAYDDVAVRFY